MTEPKVGLEGLQALIAQRDALRADVARLTAERDEARSLVELLSDNNRGLADEARAAEERARQEEREACAMVCERIKDRNYGRDVAWDVAEHCAERIRSRTPAPAKPADEAKPARCRACGKPLLPEKCDPEQTGSSRVRRPDSPAPPASTREGEDFVRAVVDYESGYRRRAFVGDVVVSETSSTRAWTLIVQDGLVERLRTAIASHVARAVQEGDVRALAEKEKT